MGVIQGSINQLLGLGAIASKAIASKGFTSKPIASKETSGKEAQKAPLEAEIPQENTNKETEDKKTGQEVDLSLNDDSLLTEYEQKLLKQQRARDAAQAELLLEQERLSRSRNFRKNKMEEENGR